VNAVALIGLPTADKTCSPHPGLAFTLPSVTAFWKHVADEAMHVIELFEKSHKFGK
jgi:hypothetical protein